MEGARVGRFPAGVMSANVLGYPKFARSANLSAARRGGRASNIPKRAPIRANGTNEAEPNGSVRVPGPSTVAKRSAAKGGADSLLLCARTEGPCFPPPSSPFSS